MSITARKRDRSCFLCSLRLFVLGACYAYSKAFDMSPSYASTSCDLCSTSNEPIPNLKLLGQLNNNEHILVACLSIIASSHLLQFSKTTANDPMLPEFSISDSPSGYKLATTPPSPWPGQGRAPSAVPASAVSDVSKSSIISPPMTQPVAWLWYCHLCKTQYRLGTTRRCLNDGHYFCAGKVVHTDSGRKRTRNCSSVFDYLWWKVYFDWRKNEEHARRTLGQKTQSRHGRLPRPGGRDLQPRAEPRRRHSCLLDCSYPSECRWRAVEEGQQCAQRTVLSQRGVEAQSPLLESGCVAPAWLAEADPGPLVCGSGKFTSSKAVLTADEPKTRTSRKTGRRHRRSRRSRSSSQPSFCTSCCSARRREQQSW